MSQSLEEKKAIVAEVNQQLADAEAVVIADYRGLSVEQFTRLRAKARESGIYLRVIKNTFVRRAVADTHFSQLAEHMVGPLAYGIGQDPVATAKIFHEFSKDHDRFKIKAGAMAGIVMSDKDVAALAALPSREELLAKLLGTMQAPVAKFVRTLNEIPSKFVRGLAAVRDQK